MGECCCINNAVCLNICFKLGTLHFVIISRDKKQGDSKSVSKSEHDSNLKKSKGSEAGGANKYPAGEMHVYFGSQTGTAEGFARTIMEEGKSKGS